MTVFRVLLNIPLTSEYRGGPVIDVLYMPAKPAWIWGLLPPLSMFSESLRALYEELQGSP